MPRKAKGVENEIKINQKPEANVNLSVSSSKKTSKTSSSVDKKTSTSKKGATKSADTKSKATKKTTTTKKTATKKSTTSKKSSLESKKDTTAVKTTKSSSKKSETSATSKDKTKTTSSKKADTKATSTRKTVSKAKKEVSSSEQAMKASTKKTTAKKSTSKATKTTTATKKSTAKKLSEKKTATKSTKTKAKKEVTAKKAKAEEILEYYDLPYRYNETTVKILAQTPKKLFIYWDISDNDRKNYVEKFGDEFFNNTVPVLIVHNASQNYTFEVEINDFANCWYLDINDTKCEYNIELGRRSKNQHFSIPNNYIYVTSSNVIESPNDHILFEKQTKTVYFRNVKTNATHSKDIANISFIRNMGKIYNIYDAYKKLYNKMYSDEDIIDINNPSSNNPTSTFK